MESTPLLIDGLRADFFLRPKKPDFLCVRPVGGTSGEYETADAALEEASDIEDELGWINERAACWLWGM